MYTLYAVHSDFYGSSRNLVAIFTTSELAYDYVEKSQLPNGNFRKDSLLYCAGYDVEYENDVSLNPEPPSGPPQKEYLVVYKTNFNDRETRVFCGSLENAQKKKVVMENYGYVVEIVEREV